MALETCGREAATTQPQKVVLLTPHPEAIHQDRQLTITESTVNI